MCTKTEAAQKGRFGLLPSAGKQCDRLLAWQEQITMAAFVLNPSRD
ncbi:MAG: hypothetical protein ABJ311_05030 [Erythrobacter sp.]